MKPLYLEMEGFGPYLEKTEIDFTKLPNHLTLISGNTGAGKTTIFDAICCALFGETSGNNRSFKQMRSEFCEDSDPTRVRFKFELKGDVYEVTRTPAYERKKRNSEEYTTVAPSADLIMPDKTVISKMQNVTEKIKEILGIQKDEFKQIVMIAQNDFMAMIKGTGKTQEEVFNRIFNANLFENFSKRLLQKKNEAQEKYRSYSNSILSALDNSGIRYDSEEVNSDYINTNKLKEFIKEEETKVKDEVQVSRKNLNEKREILDQANITKNKALTIIEDINRRKEVKENLEKLNREQKEIKELEIRRDKAKQARDIVLGPYTKVQTTKDRINQNYIRLEQAGAQKQEIASQLDKTKEKLAQFSDEKLNSLYLDFNNLKEVIPEYEALDKLEKNLNKQEENFQKLKEEFNKEKTNLDLLEKKNDSIEVISDNELINQRDLIENQIIRVNQTKADILELNNIFSQINEIIQKLNQTGSGLKDLKLTYFTHKTNFDQAFEDYIKNQAAFLAKDLKKDEPCPVCGSIDHPKPAQFTGREISQEELDILKSDLESAERVFREHSEFYTQQQKDLEYSIENFKKTLERINSEIKPDEKALLENYLESLKKYKAQLIKSPNPDLTSLRKNAKNLLNYFQNTFFSLEAQLKELEREYKQINLDRQKNQENQQIKEALIKKIDELQIELEEEQENINQKKNLVIELSTQIKTRKEKLAYLSYQEAISHLKQKEEKLQTYKQNFENIKSEHEKQTKELDLVKGEILSINNGINHENEVFAKEKLLLNESLIKADFSNIEDFKRNNLSPEELKEISDSINLFYNQLIQIKEQLKELDKRLENSATRF